MLSQVVEIDHLVKALLPQAIDNYHKAKRDAPNSKPEKLPNVKEGCTTPIHASKEKMIQLFEKFTVLQHMEVVNYLKSKSEEKYLFQLRLQRLEKPDTKHTEEDGALDHGIKHVLDKIKYNEVTFVFPQYAQEHGAKGPVVDAYVAQEAANIIGTHFSNACIHVAGMAVWHTCQYYGTQCAHESHHLARIKTHHDLTQKVQAHEQATLNAATDLENQRKDTQAVGAAGAGESGSKGEEKIAKSWEENKMEKDTKEKKDAAFCRHQRKRLMMQKKTPKQAAQPDVAEGQRLAANVGHMSRSIRKLHHSKDDATRLRDVLKTCHLAGIDGANWKNPAHDSWTPLMIAAYNNRDVAVDILLDSSQTSYTVSDWSATNCFGETTFHLIAHSPHHESNSDKSKKIGFKLAEAAGIGLNPGDGSGTETTMQKFYDLIKNVLTFPHHANAPTVKHSAYIYGRKFTDWQSKKENKGKIDTDYEHIQEDRKESCCGFKAPRCARCFAFLDAPITMVREFFERNWVNGGLSVHEYADLYGSDILSSIEHKIKKKGD